MQCFQYGHQVACEDNGITLWVVGACLGIIATTAIIFFMFIFPLWRVWAAHKRGEAELAQAKNEQNIQVAQAESRLRAADINRQAAIIEAEAVAAQVKAIGTELKQHDLFLKWQWIKMMEDRSGDETIYVPTEAGLPILEATRRQNAGAHGD